MNAAARNRAAGQGHVDGFARELGLHGHVGDFFAARVQESLDLSLGLVDGRAAFTLLLGRQAGQAAHQGGHGTVLADVLGLGVFQSGTLFGGREIGLCRLHDLH